jgi:CIC family chloride channel protein
MTAFEKAEAEALAVIDSVEKAEVVGLLTEAYTLRRYKDELEQRRQELLGE